MVSFCTLLSIYSPSDSIFVFFFVKRDFIVTSQGDNCRYKGNNEQVVMFMNILVIN